METQLIQYGIKVIANDLACLYNEFNQFRFPKSKKKRIRIKWKKNHKNYRIEQKERFITIEDKLIVSSQTYEMLKNNLN